MLRVSDAKGSRQQVSRHSVVRGFDTVLNNNSSFTSICFTSKAVASYVIFACLTVRIMSTPANASLEPVGNTLLTGSDISQQAIGDGGQGQAPMTGLNLNGIEVEAASRLLDQMVNGQGPFGVKAFRISRMRMMTTTTMEGTATALCRTIMKSADCSSRHEYKGMFYQPKQTRAAILACCNSCLLQL